MQKTLSFICGLSIVLLAAGLARSDDEARAVKVGEITIKVPADWQQQEPSNRLRIAQFAIPAAQGDQEPAELSVFAFGAGGTVQQHVLRWVGQFEPDGRKLQATTGKSPHGEYVFVDLAGTYKKPVGPFVQQRTEPMPGARMLVAMISVEKKGSYFLKLVGHEKTIAAQAEAFREAFGAADEEQPLELGEG